LLVPLLSVSVCCPSVKATLITGGNRVVCDECTAAAGGRTVKKAFWERSLIDAATLSDTLVITLKRFTLAGQGSAAAKVNDYLSFPMTLDLGPYTRPPEQHGPPLGYELSGVIVHKGEASHGHYYSFIKHRSGQWFQLDDEKVSSSSAFPALSDRCP